MFKKISEWFLSFFRKKRKLYTAKLVDEPPTTYAVKVIYLETHLQQPWQASMICPCGCKQILYMNLLEEYHPYWKFTIHKHAGISLHPSVHRTVGCKSHFFVSKGDILWCKNEA